MQEVRQQKKEKRRMNLNEWREQQGYSWLKLSIELGIYANRLNRLRSGKSQPTEEELKALLDITKTEVDSFR